MHSVAVGAAADASATTEKVDSSGKLDAGAESATGDEFITSPCPWPPNPAAARMAAAVAAGETSTS